jgi:hypothetical protein
MLTASINIAPLLGNLQALGLGVKQPLQQFVREQGRLYVSSSGNVPGMVQTTPPFSAGTTAAKARKQGEGKVRRDIRRVYGIPSDLYGLIKQRDEKLAGAFWGLLWKGKQVEANQIARRITGYEMVPFDHGAAHQARRGQDGNVSGKRPSFYVIDPAELEKFITKMMSHVGIYGSGFNAAAAELGAKGVPKFMLDHGTRFSGIRIQETPTSFFVTISDNVPFGQADTVRRMRYVLNYRDAALRRQMPYLIRAAIKKAGFATTAAALT